MKIFNDTQLESELREFADPDELDGLMALTTMLGSLAQPELSPATQEATWRELSARQAASGRASFWRPWLLMGAPVLAALSLTVVVLAQGAAPATPLYSIKRLSENAQLAIAFTPASKAQLCALYMKRRANELAALPSGQNPATVGSLTDQVTAEAVEYVEYANKSGTHKTQLYSHLRLDALNVMASLEAAKQTQAGAAQTKSIDAALKHMAKLTLPAV